MTHGETPARPARWRIFISSSHGTKQDEAARELLAKEMDEQWGVSPILYTRPDFPIAYDSTIRENCLRALDSCQCVLLLINSIYGATVPEIGASYTEDEYRHAVANGIPVVTLVSDRVQKDAFRYRTLPSEDRQAFLTACASVYDDPARLFAWVLDIADAADRERQSTILFPYAEDEPSRLPTIALARLRGLSRYFIEAYLVREQARAVGAKLSYDIFSLGTDTAAVDVAYESAPAEAPDIDLVSSIHARMKEQAGVRIILSGDAGSGKTTAVERAYAAATRAYEADPRGGSAPIPLFFSLSDRGADYALSDRLLRDLWNELAPRGTAYPSFLVSEGLSFDYYLDALDEVCDGISASQLDALVTSVLSLPTAHSILLSTRRHLVKALELYGRISAFHYRYRLLGWDRAQILRFVGTHTPAEEAAWALTALDRLQTEKHEGTHLTPLIVKLVLWNICNEGILAFKTRTSHVTVGLLLRRTVDAMCRQELRRRGGDPDAMAATALRLLRTFAWRIHRADGALTDVSLLQKTLESEFGLPHQFSPIPLFYAVSSYRATPIHLQFEEYLLAEQAIALMSEPASTGELYRDQTILSSETNRMIADLIAVEPREKREALIGNLKTHYAATTNHQERIVILYMMPRLVMSEPKLLPSLCIFLQKELKRHLRHKHHLECIAILNWFTQLEDHAAEQQYYRLLTTSPAFDSLNRGVYLIYHRDVREEFGYTDDEGAAWNQTADRFREHFYSPEDRQKFLRPIDMTIIRSFIETHGSVPAPIRETYGSVDEDELVERTLYAPADGSTQPYVRALIARGKLTIATAASFETHLRETYRALRASIDSCDTR